MNSLDRFLKLGLSFFMTAAATGCAVSGHGLDTPGVAAAGLNSPVGFTLTGSGTSNYQGLPFIFADSTGAISASTNQIEVTISDPAAPLEINDTSAVFTDTYDSGYCVLPLIYSQSTDASNQTLYTEITATQCTDQASINVYFDASQLQDGAGNIGEVYLQQDFTVDLAPAVLEQATGYPSTDGTGAATSTPGNFSLSGDHTLVLSFTKSVQGGALTSTFTGTGCAATLGSPSILQGSNGTTVFWTLTPHTQATTSTCTLNVSQITDVVGNPVDPNSKYVSMTVNFTT